MLIIFILIIFMQSVAQLFIVANYLYINYLYKYLNIVWLWALVKMKLHCIRFQYTFQPVWSRPYFALFIISSCYIWCFYLRVHFQWIPLELIMNLLKCHLVYISCGGVEGTWKEKPFSLSEDGNAGIWHQSFISWITARRSRLTLFIFLLSLSVCRRPHEASVCVCVWYEETLLCSWLWLELYFRCLYVFIIYSFSIFIYFIFVFIQLFSFISFIIFLF